MTRVAALSRRLALLAASHRFRSWLMVGFYAGILLTGVVGLYMPSLSAVDALPDRAALILWTLLYGITAPVGALARFKRYYPVEVLALGLIMAGTALHAVFLIDAGAGGLQTGLRMFSGLFVLAAIASALLELSISEREGQLLLDPSLLKAAVQRAAAKADEEDAAAEGMARDQVAAVAEDAERADADRQAP